jgi:hypothetical protein
MLDIARKVQEFEAQLEEELKMIALHTLDLELEAREAYFYFSIRDRIGQLRLARRNAHRAELYELCAAINKHIDRLKPMIETKVSRL